MAGTLRQLKSILFRSKVAEVVVSQELFEAVLGNVRHFPCDWQESQVIWENIGFNSMLCPLKTLAFVAKVWHRAGAGWPK